MAKDSIEEIRLLESKARKDLYNSKRLGIPPKKAPEFYELAGDRSVIEARKYGDDEKNRRKVSYLLLRAKNNYESAKELMEKEEDKEEDLKQMGGKISSVEDTIGELKSGGLEKKFAFATLAIATLAASLFFISFNLTGHVIGRLAQDHLNLLGISLFILGLIFTFFYFRKKK